MVRPKIRRATNHDWQVVLRSPVPDQWFGLVAATDAMIYGIGGAYLGTDGRWWATFQRIGSARLAKTAHKAALVTVGVADDMGITLHALPDKDITKSDAWLRRLGFAETDETLEDYTVWVRS